MLSDNLDALCNEIEQGFMQRGGWGTCRYLLRKLVAEKDEAFGRQAAQREGELRNVAAQRDALLDRLQWSNVNGGQAYLLKGVDRRGISKLMQGAVEAVQGGQS